MISYGKQHIDSSDVKAVSKVLKSAMLTQGPQINKFEEALKKNFKAKYCAVVSNGTAALHLAGQSLGWKKGDIVLTSPITFLASSNCIIYANATPNFVDICPVSYNIDVNKLEKKIKKLNARSKKVVAIVATDYAGHPCDWKSLKEISLKYKVKLVNDNCHAIGAKYNNDKNYAVKYADIVTHSYHPVKNITSGEGGSILTNQKYIYEKIKLLRSHGITKDRKKMIHDHGPWYYEMHELGYNYRITDIQCALGISQLKKINKFIKRRKEVAEVYDQFFSDHINFFTPSVRYNSSHAYHLYPLQINFNKTKISKKKLFEAMKSKNIYLQVHYVPVHLHPYYKKKYNFREGDFPIAEQFYSREVSLPIYFSIKNNEVFNIARSILKLCGK